MGLSSSIEWTEATWNPVTGCDKVSSGCKFCYAERMAARLKAMGQPNYRNGFKLTLHEHMIGLPLTWRKPQTIFVNSMSDLFHREVPLEFIQRVFQVMREAHWHRFQVLTKRAERLSSISSLLSWSPNIWMGVSVENRDVAHRIEHLRMSDSHIKFLSIEPLLGPLYNLDLSGIDWVIVGGESGPQSRPVDPAWVTDIRNQCINASIPFFFKQWGGINKKRSGRLLEGRTWDEMPASSHRINDVAPQTQLV